MKPRLKIQPDMFVFFLFKLKHLKSIYFGAEDNEETEALKYFLEPVLGTILVLERT